MTARCGVCCRLQPVELLQHADAGAVLFVSLQQYLVVVVLEL